jgi:hypothetical protein
MKPQDLLILVILFILFFPSQSTPIHTVDKMVLAANEGMIGVQVASQTISGELDGKVEPEVIPDRITDKCLGCNGSGKQTTGDGLHTFTCPDCNGTGRTSKSPNPKPNTIGCQCGCGKVDCQCGKSAQAPPPYNDARTSIEILQTVAAERAIERKIKAIYFGMESGCPPCTVFTRDEYPKVLAISELKDIFEKHDAIKEPKYWAEWVRTTGINTVPVVYIIVDGNIADKIIGGQTVITADEIRNRVNKVRTSSPK